MLLIVGYNCTWNDLGEIAPNGPLDLQVPLDLQKFWIFSLTALKMLYSIKSRWHGKQKKMHPPPEAITVHPPLSLFMGL